MRLRSVVLFHFMTTDDDHPQYPFEYSQYYHFHRVLELRFLSEALMEYILSASDSN